MTEPMDVQPDVRPEKQNEKGRDEKGRQDPLGAIFFALFLIWTGIVLLMNSTGRLTPLIDIIDQLNLPEYNLPVEIPFFDWNAWQIWFLGWGVLVVIEILLRLVVPAYRRPVTGNIIWAGVLFGLATGNWMVILPLALIAGGVALLLTGVRRRR